MTPMNSNLLGRLRNTNLAKTHGLLPLYEAVINSIHAIEEAGIDTSDGRIEISVLREEKSTQQDFIESTKRGPDAEEDIHTFIIRDNGIGFNDKNLESFKTLDSDHKVDKGCRGIGRLLWLKAFDNIRATSSFKANEDQKKERKFLFNRGIGISDIDERDIVESAPLCTTIELIGYKDRYRKSTSKTLSSIADHLFEHCLWYFIRKGGTPKILIRDENESIDLDQVYDSHMQSSSDIKKIVIKDIDFYLTHIKLNQSTSQNHSLAYCASNRLVKEDNISGKIPGLYGKLNDNENSFIYSCYITSEYLDERVRPERTDFFVEDDVDSLFSKNEISLDDIRKNVFKEIEDYLSEFLVEKKNAGKERIKNFIDNNAPRYKPILSRIPEEEQFINPEIKDKDLDLKLHGFLSEIESTIISEGHDIMVPKKNEEKDKYQERLKDYLTKVSDIKKSDLANYVSHRKVILDLLKVAIERDEDGRYSREDLIHQLIIPMQVQSNQLMFEDSNLWLLDEKLAFHDYLASDKTLKSMPITDSNSTKEPDIISLNVFDNPLLFSEGESLPLASIVVIEIKRPMRNDAKAGEDKDPIEQALGYLERVRNGKVKTSLGRPIPKSESIPGYCYILADLTESVQKRCKFYDATLTSDGLGYFFYNKSFNAYVEVISFDQLLNSAKARNRAFFDKLSLPTN